MSLAAGARLGPYEIIAAIGAGGMGEVYRARDTKLGRDVALKILPAAVAHDPERLQRFEREARFLASLNHPHIGAIYGFEQSGDTGALVLELIEGDTLAERLRRGPVSIKEALPMALQIADALDAAHERGIVHRDLKPANIKITAAASVKVLDFGLAKMMAGAASAHDLSASPTLTVDRTGQGAILGTAAYMSPEQARGQPVDKRTDIWAFGCVLCEMLTGRAPFVAATVSDTIAGILDREPDWTRLPADTPSAIRHVLVRCLEKDPKRRLRDIADVRFELEDVSLAPVAQSRQPIATHSTPMRFLWPSGFALFVLGVATAWYASSGVRRSSRAAVYPSRLSISAPAGAEIREGSAISPDGRTVVFVARASGVIKLWIRPLDSLNSRELPGTETATYPFWSPDSRAVAFFATGKLKRIDVTTGVVNVVCDVGLGRGGTWNEQGTILLNSVNDGPLVSVPAAGGRPAPVTTLDTSRGENSHRWPYFLPDGQRFLYYIRAANPDVAGVYLGSLTDPREKVRIVDSPSNAVFIPAGASSRSSLAWVQNGNLTVQPFDVERRRIDAEPVALAQNVHFNVPARNGEISVSADGVLLYGTESAVEYRLTWFDREGKPQGTLGQPDVYETARISPDGARVAVFRPPSGGIAILEMPRGIATPLVTGFWGAWSPDGTRVAFGWSPSGAPNVYTIPISGDRERVRLTESPHSQRVLDWSSDGRFLVYAEQPNDIASATKSGIWVLPLADRKPFLLVQTAYSQAHAQFSPDARWIAYTSTELGHPEIHVQSFPAGRGKWQVSTNGGDLSRWRRDGAELLYVAPDQTLISTPVHGAEGVIRFGETRPLFKLAFPAPNPSAQSQDYPYDVAENGRILGFTPAQVSPADGLVVFSNWAELTRSTHPSEQRTRGY